MGFIASLSAAGDHAARTGERRWHGATGMFVAAAGMLLGTMAKQPLPAFVCMCAAGIGVYAPFGVWWSYPTTFLSGAAAAGAIGMINSFGKVGGFVGPYLMGYLKEQTGGYSAGWVCLAAFLACAGLVTLTLRSSAAGRGAD